MTTERSRAATALSPRILEEDLSYRTRMMGIAEGLEDVIAMGRGDPDFHTPPHIVEAAKRAIDADQHHYTPPHGLPQLREAIATNLRRFDLDYTPAEIAVTAGVQEAIMLCMLAFVDAGDEVLITSPRFTTYDTAVHLCGGTPVPVPTYERDDFALMPGEIEARITDRTKLIGLVHVSNALGTVNPVERVCEIARERGIVTVIDGCQALPHVHVDVQKIGCDFYAFSAHKMYGPTGIGALYGREALLDAMPPWQGGGEMILRVSFDETTYNELPHKFEAGTPNIAGAIGMGAAFDFLDRIGIDPIDAHEQDLLAYATDRMQAIDGLRILGTAADKGPVISFVVDGAHANDIGTIVDHFGVALRTGHHCAMPVMQFFDVPATARVSFGCYTTRGEIDTFLEALDRARAMLA